MSAVRPWIAVALLALSAGLAPMSALAATGSGTCHLGDVAAKDQKIVGQDGGTAINTAFTAPEPVSKAACLSTLINSGMNSIITIPSLGNIVKNLVNRACHAAQRVWNNTTSQVTRAVSLPYGLAHISPAGGYNLSVPGASGSNGQPVAKSAQNTINKAVGKIDRTANNANQSESQAVSSTNNASQSATRNVFGSSSNGSSNGPF